MLILVQLLTFSCFNPIIFFFHILGPWVCLYTPNRLNLHHRFLILETVLPFSVFFLKRKPGTYGESGSAPPITLLMSTFFHVINLFHIIPLPFFQYFGDIFESR